MFNCLDRSITLAEAQQERLRGFVQSRPEDTYTNSVEEFYKDDYEARVLQSIDMLIDAHLIAVGANPPS